MEVTSVTGVQEAGSLAKHLEGFQGLLTSIREIV